MALVYVGKLAYWGIGKTPMYKRVKASLKRKASRAKGELIDNALRSDYMKRTYDYVPTWIISYLLRFIVDLFIYYQLRSSTAGWVSTLYNMVVSVVISVVLSIFSPFFYDLADKYNDQISQFTNHVTKRMTWDYFYKWQTRIGAFVGLTAIIALYFVQITSVWVIECIVHTMICGFVTGLIEDWQLRKKIPVAVEVNVFNVRKDMYQHQHNIHDANPIAANYTLVKPVQYGDTMNTMNTMMVLESYRQDHRPKPQRAIVIYVGKKRPPPPKHRPNITINNYFTQVNVTNSNINIKCAKNVNVMDSVVIIKDYLPKN